MSRTLIIMAMALGFSPLVGADHVTTDPPSPLTPGSFVTLTIHLDQPTFSTPSNADVELTNFQLYSIEGKLGADRYHRQIEIRGYVLGGGDVTIDRFRYRPDRYRKEYADTGPFKIGARRDPAEAPTSHAAFENLRRADQPEGVVVLDVESTQYTQGEYAVFRWWLLSPNGDIWGSVSGNVEEILAFEGGDHVRSFSSEEFDTQLGLWRRGVAEVGMTLKQPGRFEIPALPVEVRDVSGRSARRDDVIAIRMAPSMQLDVEALPEGVPEIVGQFQMKCSTLNPKRAGSWPQVEITISGNGDLHRASPPWPDERPSIPMIPRARTMDRSPDGRFSREWIWEAHAEQRTKLPTFSFLSFDPDSGGIRSLTCQPTAVKGVRHPRVGKTLPKSPKERSARDYAEVGLLFLTFVVATIVRNATW